MSRLGKKIIDIPAGTEVSYANGTLTVKGKLGSLNRTIDPSIEVKVENNQITFSPKRNSGNVKSLWGTVASHTMNLIDGVNTGFTKKLVLEGVGYKSEVKGQTIALALGFSHPVNVTIPQGLTVKAEKNVITISGIDKELVGSFTAEVRSLKKPEPYKGKGFRYSDEVIRRKEGKKSV